MEISRGRRAISNILLELLHNSTTVKQELGYRTDLPLETVAPDSFRSPETVLAGSNCNVESDKMDLWLFKYQ